MPQVKTLTDEQIKAAAEGAGLEYAALKAVVVVESSGAGFLDDGQPKILFEGHVFWKQLEALGLDPAQLAQGNGDILHSMWDKSKYQGGAAEHQRLHRAARLSPGPAPPGLSPGPSPAGNEPALDSAALAGGVDELFSLGPLAPAALCSVSWGLFKIMGFNWRLCGYKSLQDFIKAMYRDEASHLVAAMGFLKGSGLIPALRSLDWAAFAKGYNGPGYSASKYDLKLARAYKAAKG